MQQPPATMREGTDPMRLIVVLRGMADRAGGRNPSQRNSAHLKASESTDEQYAALTSFDKHVLAPDHRIGWNV